MEEVKNYLEGAVAKNEENEEEEKQVDEEESNYKDEPMQEDSN